MRVRLVSGFLVCSAVLAIAACGTPRITDLPSAAPETVDPPLVPDDTFEILGGLEDAQADLCAPGNDQDRLTDVFCADPAPNVQSLQDLMVALGIDFKDPNGGNGTGGNPGFAILGNSSALTARDVSSITPTVFVFTPPYLDTNGEMVMPADYTFLAFDPGQHFVEVAAQSPEDDGDLNFYLVLFDQPCMQQDGGCTNAQMLTSAVTKNWTNVRAFEDTDSLGNTLAACAICHDPQNTGDRMLRMQEITPPFTHWFSEQTEGGKALLSDFHGAHGTNEDYGPVPASMIDKSDPALMAQALGILGFDEQPNAFASEAIEAEVKQIAPMQPATNIPLGWSATWQAAYDEAVAGRQIATPYHDVKVTDPFKLAAMSTAYRSWLAGDTADLPDIRDVFLDDGLRDMGFAPKAGLNGKQLLQQMCQECHNHDLERDLTRDRFRVDDLPRMSRAERDLAIQRLQMPITTRLAMPPALFRTVTTAERAKMIAVLQEDPIAYGTPIAP